MLLAHLDTVPLCQCAVPVVRGNFVRPASKETALGADDRAGAAAVLTAALEILGRGLPHPPLVFVWTIQEEVGLYGARNLQLGLLGRPRLAFNFDGGSPEKITVGATGGYRMKIRIEGIAAHAGNRPEEGASAVAAASLAVARLHRDGWHGLIEKDGRRGTSNVGVIRGGEATNVVTPLVDVYAEARSHDPAFRGEIVQAIERAFHNAAREVRNCHGQSCKVHVDGRLDYEAFRLADDDPSVATAEAAVRRVGGRPIRAISNGCLDANWLTARGIPHRLARLRPGERPHDRRAARPRPIPPRLRRGPLSGDGRGVKRVGLADRSDRRVGRAQRAPPNNLSNAQDS